MPGSASLFAGTFLVPAGNPAEPFDYLYKVRLNGSWNENYGDATFGLPDGNIPLAIDHDTELRFTYDHATHKVTVGPAQPAGGLTNADRALAGDSLREDLTRENFYFVMADRFENGDSGNDTAFIEGTRSDHGFDPTDQAFYHGGDLQGLIERLDYIEGLGTTAIWMTPSFKNKPVQGEPGTESAGYHGYWITDFTQIDPHLGTNEELKTLIDLAHDRGMKVFFDIITNHTADVLDYPGRRVRRNGAGAVQDEERRPRTRTPPAIRSTTGSSPSSATRSPRSTRTSPSRTCRRSVTRPTRPSRSRPGSTTGRCTTTAAPRRSPGRTANTATSPRATAPLSTTCGPSGPRSCRA